MVEHLSAYPDAAGYYGRFGGVHYPDHLHPVLDELAALHERSWVDPAFQDELQYVRTHFLGRPTPTHFLRNLTAATGGAALFVKREDLNHTGAHKLNHCIGFGLLAERLGRTKLIAETGAGQHGVAVATAAAYFGLDAEIHMGDVDIVKARSNVRRMRILGAEVVAAGRGQAALKEASDSAFEAFARQHESALYAIGSAIGPHPFPRIVRDFQSVIGHEARAQFVDMTGALPDHVVACVAGGSNAMGIFSGFLDDTGVALHGVEPLGSSGAPGEHAATVAHGGVEGTIHGARCLVLQDADGAPSTVASVASGLVYPGVGPEISMLHATGRAGFSGVTDDAAIAAFHQLSRTEGIIPALESAHAIAYAVRLAATLPSTSSILINLSGRGDKDVDHVVENAGDVGW